MSGVHCCSSPTAQFKNTLSPLLHICCAVWFHRAWKVSGLWICITPRPWLLYCIISVFHAHVYTTTTSLNHRIDTGVRMHEIKETRRWSQASELNRDTFHFARSETAASPLPVFPQGRPSGGNRRASEHCGANKFLFRESHHGNIIQWMVLRNSSNHYSNSITVHYNTKIVLLSQLLKKDTRIQISVMNHVLIDRNNKPDLFNVRSYEIFIHSNHYLLLLLLILIKDSERGQQTNKDRNKNKSIYTKLYKNWKYFLINRVENNYNNNNNNKWKRQNRCYWM